MKGEFNKRHDSRIEAFFKPDVIVAGVDDANMVDGTNSQAVERFQYDPYGIENCGRNSARAENAEDFAIEFHGSMPDATGEALHFGARDFSPEPGRWMEQDPTPLAYVDDGNVFPVPEDE